MREQAAQHEAAQAVDLAGDDGRWVAQGGESMPEFIVGHTTQDIDATRVMWDFFQKHPLPGD